MKDIKVFIAAHKKFNLPVDDVYIPLHVGAEGKDDLGYTKDNTGDNISSKNPYYCELTGVYWIWKNVKADVVGLVHYRRYFYNHVFSKDICSKDEFEKIFDKYDVVVAQRGYVIKTVGDNYKDKHVVSDIDDIIRIVHELHPDYDEALNTVFNRHHYSPCNMIVCKKEIFDEYCEWLFSIFDELEKAITVSVEGRDSYQRRIYGFLSERLLNVYLEKHKEYKVVEKPIYNNEGNMFLQRVIALLKSPFSMMR